MGKKILIADDSVTMQQVISMSLASYGYEIFKASQGADAIRIIETEIPDIVLIDITLPQKNAFEIKNIVNQKSELSSVKFILLVSAFEKLDERVISDLKFSGRLVKPFDPGLCRKVVAQAMAATSDGPSMKIELPKKESTRELQIDPPVSSPINIQAMSPPPPPPPPPSQSAVTSYASPPPPPPSPSPSPQIQTGSINSAYTPQTMVPPPPPIQTPSNIQTVSSTPPPPPMAPPIMVQPPSLVTSMPDTIELDEEEEKELNDLESDIKGLTESTIKLSGLDEVEWNIDDSKNKKQNVSTVQIATPPPLPKQPSAQSDQESIKQNKINLTLIKEEPTIDMNMPVRPYDDGGSNFFNVPEITIQDTIEELPPSLEAMSNIAQFTGGTITKAEIEELIRKELQSSFEKIVREEFPLIAEKIIRKEIEKVLSEP